MEPLDDICNRVSETGRRFPEIQFAYLFGSAVQRRLRADSDLDVAVYVDSHGALEIEVDRDLDRETEIQLALERATNRNIDLLLLNRAPATVCASALLNGRQLYALDPSLYSRYFLAVTSVAIDFLETARDYRRIRDRSASIAGRKP